MIATSGWVERTRSTSSTPSPACPTTSKPDRSSRLARPSRSRTSSSAMTTPVLSSLAGVALRSLRGSHPTIILAREGRRRRPWPRSRAFHHTRPSRMVPSSCGHIPPAHDAGGSLAGNDSSSASCTSSMCSGDVPVGSPLTSDTRSFGSSATDSILSLTGGAEIHTRRRMHLRQIHLERRRAVWCQLRPRTRSLAAPKRLDAVFAAYQP